jgi:hypothetical protein
VAISMYKTTNFVSTKSNFCTTRLAISSWRMLLHIRSSMSLCLQHSSYFQWFKVNPLRKVDFPWLVFLTNMAINVHFKRSQLSILATTVLFAIRARLHLSNVAWPPWRYSYDSCTWPMNAPDVPNDTNFQTHTTYLLLTYAGVMGTKE